MTTRSTCLVPGLLSVFLMGACSGGHAGSPDVLPARPDARRADGTSWRDATSGADAGGHPDALPSLPDGGAYTWSGYMSKAFPAFCARCHQATTAGSGHQNFTCLYCYDPSTGACATSMSACGSSTVPGVASLSHVIICGILPASTTSYTGCPDSSFPAPFGQFPADCNVDDPSLWGRTTDRCPTDTERMAIVHWLEGGAAP